jgi:anti-sigma-K factor RskA
MDTAKTPAEAARTTASGKNSKTSAHATIFPAWAWIAAVALALVTGYTIRRMNNQNDQLAQLRKQMKLAMMQNQSLQNQLDMNRMVAMIMMSSDSLPLKLIPKDKDLPAIRTYLHPHMGMAITADQMSSLPPTRTLQLWFVAKTGRLVSVAIFHPDATGQIALVAPITIPLNEIAALSVSDEPAGGSPQPTSPMAWTTKIN